MTFKHALVRDVAYQSMLKYARIAGAIQRQFPETVTRALQAGCTQKAMEFGYLPGHKPPVAQPTSKPRSISRGRFDLVRAQPKSPARSEMELKVLASLVTALLLVKGWTAPEAEAISARARALDKPDARIEGTGPPNPRKAA